MSCRPRYQKEITDRIQEFSKGSVFSAADFMDIADTDAINKALSRLVEEGRIRRVTHGLYDVPEYNSLLQEYAVPRPDMVAEALARKFNWTIAPCGDTALNALHLSTQVPNVWSYVSDGPYRKYDLGNTKLSFKTVKQREISGFHRITITVIQALIAKTCGHDRRGKEIYKRDENGDPITVEGVPVIDNDFEEITRRLVEHVKSRNIYN